MDAYKLGQILIVAPDLPFAEVARALSELGAERDDAAPRDADPNAASWRFHGGKPFITYTRDRALSFAVLDVAGAPPSVRAAIVARVRTMPPDALASLASSADARDRRRFLLGAREIERLEWTGVAERLCHDPDRSVSEAAAPVVAALHAIAAARVKVHAALGRLKAAVSPLLPNLDDPVVVQGLRPRPDDVVKLFDDSIADHVAAAVVHLWSEAPLADTGSGYPNLAIVASPAGLLRSPNELSDRFPRGYRDIAGWLVASRIWLTWAFDDGRGGSVRYDGLAWIDDHWVWIPKPYRLVAAAVASRARLAATAH